MSDRTTTLRDAVESLYEYLVTVSHATWQDKRPGLTWRPPQLIVKSCGAYRRWAIFAVSGRVILSADGFAVRQNRRGGGGVSVATGSGRIYLPPDDSRSDHSLQPKVEAGEVVNVTNEPGPWDEVIAAMVPELRNAKADLDMAVMDYDARRVRSTEDARQRQLREAREAVTGGTP